MTARNTVGVVSVAAEADVFAVELAALLDADDYPRLSAQERSFATLAADALLEGDVESAHRWAERYRSAADAIAELFARRDKAVS